MNTGKTIFSQVMEFLPLFPWAHFRKSKGAIKLHTLIDLRGPTPSFIDITDGKVADVNVLDILIPEAGSFYIMDRGYLDFARLYTMPRARAAFITRTKSNTQCRRLYSRPADKTTGLRCDQTIVLTGVQSAKDYPEQLRCRRNYRSTTLQMPLESRTLFPLDQTAFAHQDFFGNITKCRQDAGLDCNLGLRAHSHYQKNVSISNRVFTQFYKF